LGVLDFPPVDALSEVAWLSQCHFNLADAQVEYMAGFINDVGFDKAIAHTPNEPIDMCVHFPVE
jgi:hypothetical protein